MSSQFPSNPSQQARPRRARAATVLLLSALGLHGALAAAAPATEAVPHRGGSTWVLDGATATVTKGDLSMDEAIDRAQKRFRARVVRAEQVEQGGRVVYVLRLLSDEDGRVFTVRVDARSGAMQ